jgi:hypothetical protein
MDKGKTFVGQPILAQIISCIPKNEVQLISKAHNSDRYYKKLPLQTHLTTLLYGILSCCNGLREICEGMLACEGKLSHLGLLKAPARGTLSDANTKRDWKAFESIYYMLLKRYNGFLSDSRLKGLRIRNLKIIDSTTLRLFSDLLRGVGRNPIDGGRKKGGIKVHTLMDAFSGVASFVRMTEAKVHDKKFLAHLVLETGSFIVFDKAYNEYRQFAKWMGEQIWFVTRMKSNALFNVRKVITDNTKKKNAKGVIKEQYVSLTYKAPDGTQKKLELRRITFKADNGKVYYFITNNFKISARPGGTRLQAPVDDRTALQTDQAELPVELFLGRKRERHPHPNLLCPHCTSAHGGDRQKSRNQKIVHQHPHRGATAHHELCGTFCVFKRHLQGMEEFAQPTAGQQVGH